MYVGEPKIPTLEPVRQSGVVDAEQLQDGGLQIVNVYRVFDYVHPKVVRLTIGKPRFHATAGHPRGERIRVVIAPPAFALSQFFVAWAVALVYLRQANKFDAQAAAVLSGIGTRKENA